MEELKKALSHTLSTFDAKIRHSFTAIKQEVSGMQSRVDSMREYLGVWEQRLQSFSAKDVELKKELDKKASELTEKISSFEKHLGELESALKEMKSFKKNIVMTSDLDALKEDVKNSVSLALSSLREELMAARGRGKQLKRENDVPETRKKAGWSFFSSRTA